MPKQKSLLVRYRFLYIAKRADETGAKRPCHISREPDQALRIPLFYDTGLLPVRIEKWPIEALTVDPRVLLSMDGRRLLIDAIAD